MIGAALRQPELIYVESPRRLYVVHLHRRAAQQLSTAFADNAATAALHFLGFIFFNFR